GDSGWFLRGEVARHFPAQGFGHPLVVSPYVFAAVAKAEGTELIIAGKQAIDNDMNATGQMLAARRAHRPAMGGRGRPAAHGSRTPRPRHLRRRGGAEIRDSRRR
ncbi:hypothetical protein VB636_04565, partial [Paracoccus sp. APAP_BH8]